MNSLSWLIYWIGFADGFSSICLLFSIIGGVGCIVTFIMWLVIGFNPKDEDCIAMQPFFGRFRAFFTTLFAIFTVLFLFLPTRQTIILMAGSQIGERIVKSETVQGVVNPGLDLLKMWMKKETDTLMKANTPAPKKDG